MVIGTLAGLRRYPVKSLRAEVHECLEVGMSGIPGDRADALFVRSGHARIGKTYRGKEHERLHLLSSARTAVEAAAQRGTAVEIQHAEHFFDDAPISLIVDRWLGGLNEHLGYAVEWERFRPNFFVRSVAEFTQSEQQLTGAELQLGAVQLRVKCPIERCVTTTYHPQGLPSDPRILRYVAQERNAGRGL